MSTKARARARSRQARRDSLPVFGIAIGVVVAIGILAVVVVATGGGDDGEPAADDRPQFRPVEVTGDAIPPYPVDGSTDPALGAPAPELSGRDFDGRQVEVRADGRPKALVFLAHWCPHCQAEAPRLADYLAQTGLPRAVDLVVVPTGTDSRRDNFPPSAWLAREDLAGLPTIVDGEDQAAARAFGLSVYPFLVLLDADHRVAGRVSGEHIDFEGLFRALAAGEPLPLPGDGATSPAG